MIRICITATTFEAIFASLPFGFVGVECEADALGEKANLAGTACAQQSSSVILTPMANIRFGLHGLSSIASARRIPGESYSDVILRLAKG